MNILENILAVFRTRKIKKFLSDVPTGFIPLDKIANVNVVIDVEEPGFDLLKEDILAWGRQNGLKVNIYFFDFRKLGKDELLLTSIQTTIIKKELDWLGTPEFSKIGALLYEPSDLFISMVDNGKRRDTCAEIEQLAGVGDVEAHYEIQEGFETIQNILNMAALVIIAVLFVVSMLIISNTVKLAMYDRRDEIAIMKMVGATNGFIRLPFVVEGFALGMMGAAIAFCLEWVMYDALVLKLEAIDTVKLFAFVPFDELLIPMVATFVFAGLFVGIVGSWTSIRKFMDV